MSIRNYIVDNRPETNCTEYLTCPICHGVRKLSVTNYGGYILYRCFRNSCSLKPGRVNLTRNKDAIKYILAKRQRERQEFNLPTWCTPVYGHSHVEDYLKTYNCYDALQEGKAEAVYDPRADRLVWLLKEGNDIVGAVGRYVGARESVKVLTYRNSKAIPFVVGDTKEAVIVEDCASACAVSRLEGVTGVALLGTSFNENYLTYLQKYDKITIALDKDARTKALDMKKYLALYIDNIHVKFLEKDLKDMTLEETEKWYE